MTDKPIIFSAPMVRALLEGRKKQTRRLTRGLAPADRLRASPFVPGGVETTHGREVRVGFAPGDRLWVREAWRTSDAFNNFPPSAITGAAPVQWEADGGRSRSWRDDLQAQDYAGRLRPSIHMPRWASRLTLTVTEVRVQRLQEISEEDARAEGCAVHQEARPLGDFAANLIGRRASFIDLWNSLYGPDAWADNPWVCAISFTVERRNIDAPNGTATEQESSQLRSWAGIAQASEAR